MKKAILVTGGAGFIGSHFLIRQVKEQSDTLFINLDLLTNGANVHHLNEIAHLPNYHFIHADINDAQTLLQVFQTYFIQAVVHFAAQTHVDVSIQTPELFMQTNIMGTFRLLEVVKQSWFEAPFKPKKDYEQARFYHVSTDEVYGSAHVGSFTEATAYAPNNPYSASKAASDFLVRSYHQTYGLNSVMSHCSNNFGPHQHLSKFIPTVISCALAHKPIPIYGNGSHIRDWLFVKDHCDAIAHILEQGDTGQCYNIGAGQEYSNLTLAKKICALLDELYPTHFSYETLLTFVSDRPGHDWRYSIDTTKLRSSLGWRAQTDFDTALIETVQWYATHFDAEALCI